MGAPKNNLRFGVPIASADGRYYTRWPRGDKPFPRGAGVSVLASAALGTAEGGASGGNYAGYTPTIYAATTAQGNGSGSSEANAMTLAAALAAATAGAIIGVLPGVYAKTGVSLERDVPAWKTTNQGTSGNPIIVVAKYSAIDLAGMAANEAWTQTDIDAVFANANRCELRHDGTGTNGAGTGGPAFGVAYQNYVYWIGFCADEANAHPHRDTGASILWATNGSRIMRCVIVARDPGYTTETFDNHPNIRVESTDACVVSDNVCWANYVGASHNHCSIQRYESTNLIVEHNFTAGIFSGIYLKDQDASRAEIVRFNYVTNPNTGMEILNVNEGGVSDVDQVYQNLIVGSAEALVYQSQGFNIQAHHNTIITPASSFGASSCAHVCHFNGGSGSYLRDSIIVGTSGFAFIDQSFRTATPLSGTNYNRYFRSGTSFSARYNGSTYSSLSAWQSATSAISSAQDANSTVGDPSFVDMAGGNYRLSGSSPCLTLSSTGGPLGCYITGTETIGPRYQ